MKAISKNLLIMAIILVLSSFLSLDNEELIQGSWYYFDEENNYVEMHIENGKFTYGYESIIQSSILKSYLISNDSLYLNSINGYEFGFLILNCTEDLLIMSDLENKEIKMRKICLGYDYYGFYDELTVPELEGIFESRKRIFKTLYKRN
ncbi:MAG: hypothetical protein ABJF11_15795 [Reichenbachiella sp.]|uniref:hypothetical protein n=1 Tax=Reichenbachiella sp. TaxID=2184521 RepID=UPI0032648F27